MHFTELQHLALGLLNRSTYRLPTLTCARIFSYDFSYNNDWSIFQTIIIHAN
jgi:hypothetical protein